ncbi:UNVERIFIED_CONTAM: E3 ubiquitin-protein ligase SGR9, amyloplastic [Sesamum latifolium]|uniref:RING-type E3 ubiquitin transferase n=1 Tax=Sesamum latifolium TaxID=2727402 RepID=A0AAW2Y311_9LAMI
MVRIPPLNSINDYSIEVKLHRFFARRQLQSTSLLDEVRFFSDVQIDLKSSSSSSSSRSKVTSYGTIQEFSVPSNQIFFSPGKCRETMTKLLDLMNIPFSLDEKRIQWNDLYHNGRVGESKSLENSQDLISELTIAEDEFQEWKDFREKHPEEYFYWAHSQPELQMLFRWEALKVLEKVRVEKSEGGDLECSICLEELLKGEVTEVIRLPCSHIYHEICILKWLGKKQTCPYCRANSPTFRLINKANYPMLMVYKTLGTNLFICNIT